MQLLEFNQLIQTVGLGRIAAELNQVVLPSIRLVTKQQGGSQIAVGVSKLGGKPDLPKGYKWPTIQSVPLIFLAQINLAECQSFDQNNLLPKRGWLYFFFNQEFYFQRIIWHKSVKEAWQVLYFDGEVTELQRTITPAIPPEYTPLIGFNHRSPEYMERGVTFTTQLTLPDYSAYDADSLERLGLYQPLSEAEEEAYLELQFILEYGRKRSDEDFSTVSPNHQLLGHAAPMQWDVLRDCVREVAQENMGISNLSEWQLLLQLDEDFEAGMRWSSSGRIYFCISKQDSAHKNFDNIWLVIQGT